MNVDKICYFQYAKVSNYRNSSVSHVKKFKNILLLVLFFYWSPNECVYEIHSKICDLCCFINKFM